MAEIKILKPDSRGRITLPPPFRTEPLFEYDIKNDQITLYPVRTVRKYPDMSDLPEEELSSEWVKTEKKVNTDTRPGILLPLLQKHSGRQGNSIMPTKSPPFNLHFEAIFLESYSRLKPSEQKAIDKALKLLSTNPRHPSLTVHKAKNVKGKYIKEGGSCSHCVASKHLRFTFERPQTWYDCLRNYGHRWVRKENVIPSRDAPRISQIVISSLSLHGSVET